jgi:hypothetical protein
MHQHQVSNYYVTEAIKTLTFGVALFLFPDVTAREGLFSFASLSCLTVDGVTERVCVRYLDGVDIPFLDVSDDCRPAWRGDPVLVGLDLLRRRWLGEGCLALYPSSSSFKVDAISSFSLSLSPKHNEPLVKTSSFQ